MTYQELFDAMKMFTKEQMEMEVIVYHSIQDEFEIGQFIEFVVEVGELKITQPYIQAE